MDGSRLTPDAICSGLRMIQAGYERQGEDFDIVFAEGEYGKGQHRIEVSFCRLLSEAVELLKEKEPIKPTINEYGEAYCVCGENVGIIPNSKSLPKIRSKYCSECGRRMKWDG